MVQRQVLPALPLLSWMWQEHRALRIHGRTNNMTSSPALTAPAQRTRSPESTYFLTKPDSHRIDNILDELMITSETNPIAKTELYMKLLKEASHLFSNDEEDECWKQWSFIHKDAVNLANGQNNDFTRLSIAFESVIRRRIKEKLGGV
jgi:hypothetical protein